MAEDFRLAVSLRGRGDADRLLESLRSHEVESQVRDRFGERIAVSGSDEHVLLYADSEAAAREAQQVVAEVLAQDGLEADFQLDRWHHLEEEWEDVGVPLPSTPDEERVEHEKLEAQEEAESEASGWAEWELRIEFASHPDAEAFAARLEDEGFEHVVRRSMYVLVGTVDEDEAEKLAERLRAELPAGATIQIEPGSGLSYEYLPKNPFAVFGGLAG